MSDTGIWYETPDAWRGIDNECAPEERRIPPETHAPAALPDDLGETPRLAWKRTRLCPGDDDFEEPDIRSEVRGSSLARLEVGGRERNVLLVAQTAFGKRYKRWPEAVAMLDAETGEALGCLAPPRGRDFGPTVMINTPVTPVSQTGRIYGFYTHEMSHTVDERAAELPKVRVPHGVLAWRTDGSRDILMKKELYPRSWRGPLLLSNGQLLWNYHRRQLVSVDAIDGGITWTVGPAAFSKDGRVRAEAVEEEGFWIQGPLRSGARDGLVSVVPRQSDGSKRKTRRVDRCGEPNSAKDYWSVLHLKKYRVDFAGSEAKVYDKNGEYLYSVEGCSHFVTLGDGQLVCRDFFELKIVDLNDDGRVIRKRVVDTQKPNKAGGGPSGDMVVGRGSTVVMLDTFGIDGRNVHRVTIVPMAADEMDEPVRWVDIPEPQDARQEFRDGSSESFLISPTGMVIYEAWGYVYGIQTRIPGLAKAPYPRGVAGGNENRGPIGGYPDDE